MFNSVFAKTFYEKRWTLFGWAVGLFAMTLLTMVFYPYFKNSGFEDMLATAPKSIQTLLGNASNYKTVAGYVDQQIFALRMPMLTIIMAVSLFVGVSVGDEDRGTLETLLAQPVSRTKVFWQKLAAASAVSAAACVAIFLGVVASFPIVKGSMSLTNLAAVTFGCWLVSIVFGMLAYALGTATGKRGLTIAIASTIAFGTYLISSMAPAVDKLKVAQKFTPFYYYNVPSIAQHGLKFSNLVVLAVLVVVPAIIGLLIFNARDLVRD